MQGTAVVSGDPEIDLPKATALGKSLLIFTAVPWTLCLVLYTGELLLVALHVAVRVKQPV